MPGKGKHGEFAELPATLERSPKKAQDTYERTLESAEHGYGGDEAAAHRVAWGAVKQSFEKVGDHWQAKHKRGPSDERARHGGPDAQGASYGGVDIEGKTQAELAAELKQLGGKATTHATKAMLAADIQKANQRADRAHR